MNTEAMMLLGKIISWILLLWGIFHTVGATAQYLYLKAEYLHNPFAKVSFTKRYYIFILLAVASLFFIVGTWGR